MTEPPADDGEYYLVEVTGMGEHPPQTIRGERMNRATDGADLLTVYFMRRRDVLIAELRELDRLLGRPQTIPARER